jgi:hypothetical protein
LLVGITFSKQGSSPGVACLYFILFGAFMLIVMGR